jgi:aminoglycoside phosphotransferase (APT) family kinase protein
MQHIKKVVKKIFPEDPVRVERVTEGVSTYVYRIIFQHETFYLRILPEEGASFVPEVTALTQLRQMQVKVPEIIYFEHYNEMLQRSVMVLAEVKGGPISQFLFLDEGERRDILREAGRDLARINHMIVEGFGWVKRDQSDMVGLQAQWPTHRAFAFEYWEADMAYLAMHVLQASEVVQLERVRSKYDSWLDVEQGYLAHGDFDSTQIYQDNGQYTGIIDFGEIRGADCWYDLGHFHMRDGELLPFQLLPALVSGYREIGELPEDYEQRIRFTSLFINVRTLARSLHKRPPNQHTQHQLDVLREDLAALLG